MFDLHMHSTYSDGKDSLSKLIENVKNAGITYFSLTDHDTAAGCREILKNEKLQKQIKDAGLTFVVGTEFSCLYGKYEMHILAYDFDPFAPEVAELEQELAMLLKQKDEFRLKAIEQAGYKLSKESYDFLSTRLNVRKLDYANCLVNEGYFSDVDDACVNFLNPMKYKGVDRLDAIKVITKMTKIGAKMVWAHSLHGLREKPITHEQVDLVVSELKPYGLAGLECFYSLYDKDEIDGLLQIAKKHDLFVTCGSDYHGKNKTVALAEMSSDGSPVNFDLIKVKDIFKNTIS